MDRCSFIRQQLQLYSIPEFAALWCGIREEDVDAILMEASPLNESARGSQILCHPRYACLEIRCLYIVNAINNDQLISFDEYGRERPESRDHLAWHRKRLRADKVVEWLKATGMPLSEWPPFLAPGSAAQTEAKAPPPEQGDLTPKAQGTYLKLLNALFSKFPIPRDARELQRLTQEAGFGVGWQTLDGILKRMKGVRPDES